MALRESGLNAPEIAFEVRVSGREVSTSCVCVCVSVCVYTCVCVCVCVTVIVWGTASFVDASTPMCDDIRVNKCPSKVVHSYNKTFVEAAFFHLADLALHFIHSRYDRDHYKKLLAYA